MIGAVERVQLDLRAAHGLHDGHFKRRRDGHDLTGGLHLRAQFAAGADELVERPLGQLHHHIVQRRLEAGAGLAGDLVFDLIQRVAQRDLRGHLGDGIAGRLAGQRRGARYAGIDLDDGIFERIGIERELAVATAGDAQRRYDVERGRAQHLIFIGGQRQRRRDDDRIAGMHADRIEIFHAAHGDGVARAVAHDLELDFLPARDVLFNQHLRDGRHIKAGVGHLAQLRFRVGHAAARAAQRERRTHDDRIADLIGDGERRLHVVGDVRGNARLADGGHGLLKELAVLRLVDGLGVRADQPHAVALEKALLVQLHGQRKSRLSAQPRQHAVRLFLFDDALDRLDGQRFQIDFVGQRLVGHDGGGVGVDQHDVHARVLQHAAGLRAGVVELGGLADDNGAGTDHQNLLNVFIQRHIRFPPSWR